MEPDEAEIDALGRVIVVAGRGIVAKRLHGAVGEPEREKVAFAPRTSGELAQTDRLALVGACARRIGAAGRACFRACLCERGAGKA